MSFHPFLFFSPLRPDQGQASGASSEAKWLQTCPRPPNTPPRRPVLRLRPGRGESRRPSGRSARSVQNRTGLDRLNISNIVKYRKNDLGFWHLTGSPGTNAPYTTYETNWNPMDLQTGHPDRKVQVGVCMFVVFFFSGRLTRLGQTKGCCGSMFV